MMASSQSFSIIHLRMSLSPEPAPPVKSGEPLKTIASREPCLCSDGRTGSNLATAYAVGDGVASRQRLCKRCRVAHVASDERDASTASELSIDRVEWDVMWRYTFGGMTAEMRQRLDHPEEGFTFRGRRMEHAVMSAIEECLPTGTVKVWSQPAPERIPPDHVERCARDRCSPEGWKRADIALEFVSGKTIVLDVRTTNTQSAISALADARVLETHAAEKLGDAYRFLRRVESGLRLLDTSARHDLPVDPTEMRRLAGNR